MKIENAKIILAGAACLAVLACVFAAWKLYPSVQDEAVAAHISHYAVKNGKVYWDEYLHTGAGGTDSQWRLDAVEVVAADAATFMAVPLEKGTAIEAETDPIMFTALNNSWSKDAAHIFYQGREVLPSGTQTSYLDTASFEPISDIFVRDDQGVYEIENDRYKRISGLDPKSFVVINRQYAKDAHAVYFLNDNGNNYDVLPIPGLDPTTFHVIGVCKSTEGYQLYAAADAHRVFAGEVPIVGADPATFHIVSQYDANPGGFPMAGSYAVDRNHVYKDCSEIVPGADPARCTADNLQGCKVK